MKTLEDIRAARQAWRQDRAADDARATSRPTNPISAAIPRKTSASCRRSGAAVPIRMRRKLWRNSASPAFVGSTSSPRKALAFVHQFLGQRHRPRISGGSRKSASPRHDRTGRGGGALQPAGARRAGETRRACGCASTRASPAKATCPRPTCSPRSREGSERTGRHRRHRFMAYRHRCRQRRRRGGDDGGDAHPQVDRCQRSGRSASRCGAARNRACTDRLNTCVEASRGISGGDRSRTEAAPRAPSAVPTLQRRPATVLDLFQLRQRHRTHPRHHPAEPCRGADLPCMAGAVPRHRRDHRHHAQHRRHRPPVIRPRRLPASSSCRIRPTTSRTSTTPT